SLPRRCPPPCARRTSVYISDQYHIVNYQVAVTCDLITLWARRQIPLPIPLPADSPNCRQQYDLSMIITLRGRFSGRSEAFVPAIRESACPSRGADR